MVKFEGSLTGAARAALLRKQKKTLVIGWLCVIVLATPITMPLVLGVFKEPYAVHVFMIVFASFIPIFMLMPLGKKTIARILPQRIYANQTHIVCITGEEKIVKFIEDVAKVIDCGAYYDVRFRFGKFNDKFVCQKSLLTRGSLEKFEAIFKDKLKRRRKCGHK